MNCNFYDHVLFEAIRDSTFSAIHLAAHSIGHPVGPWFMFVVQASDDGSADKRLLKAKAEQFIYLEELVKHASSSRMSFYFDQI